MQSGLKNRSAKKGREEQGFVVQFEELRAWQSH